MFNSPESVFLLEVNGNVIPSALRNVLLSEVLLWLFPFSHSSLLPACMSDGIWVHQSITVFSFVLRHQRLMSAALLGFIPKPLTSSPSSPFHLRSHCSTWVRFFWFWKHIARDVLFCIPDNEISPYWKTTQCFRPGEPYEETTALKQKSIRETYVPGVSVGIE